MSETRPGKATTAVWGGGNEHPPYERATQVPVVHSVSFRAANLGCVEKVVGPPLVTSHVECTPEERAAAGIPEGLVRYSTGIEDVADLLADLEQALAAIG